MAQAPWSSDVKAGYTEPGWEKDTGNVDPVPDGRLFGHGRVERGCDQIGHPGLQWPHARAGGWHTSSRNLRERPFYPRVAAR